MHTRAHTQVQLVDFESACDRVIGGLEKKNHVMNAAEKKLVRAHTFTHSEHTQRTQT